MQIMIKNEVEFVSVEFSFVYCLLLLDPSLVMLAGISCLAFGSLFEATSNPQSVACLLQARLVLAVLPCWLFISTRHGDGSSNVQQHHMYHLHLPLEGTSGMIGRVDPWFSPGSHCSVFREDGGYVPFPLCHMPWSVPGNYNNV